MHVGSRFTDPNQEITNHQTIMSMDLAVWSARPFNLPAELPKSRDWKRTIGKEFAFSGRGWHVLVLSSDEDEPESNIVEKLPGAAHVA
jgi:hypothetical protein